ncbi:hypothetical protein MIR68_011738 [Amoeboaphelidium protococcarum]|nr:hypothetical protein MIR68_011738 [Amoeboaphelidium protococcarum]
MILILALLILASVVHSGCLFGDCFGRFAYSQLPASYDFHQNLNPFASLLVYAADKNKKAVKYLLKNHAEDIRSPDAVQLDEFMSYVYEHHWPDLLSYVPFPLSCQTLVSALNKKHRYEFPKYLGNIIMNPAFNCDESGMDALLGNWKFEYQFTDMIGHDVLKRFIQLLISRGVVINLAHFYEIQEEAMRGSWYDEIVPMSTPIYLHVCDNIGAYVNPSKKCMEFARFCEIQFPRIQAAKHKIPVVRQLLLEFERDRAQETSSPFEIEFEKEY